MNWTVELEHKAAKLVSVLIKSNTFAIELTVFVTWIESFLTTNGKNMIHKSSITEISNFHRNDKKMNEGLWRSFKRVAFKLSVKAKFEFEPSPFRLMFMLLVSLI